jgi:hypothetical protein
VPNIIRGYAICYMLYAMLYAMLCCAPTQLWTVAFFVDAVCDIFFICDVVLNFRYCTVQYCTVLY